MISLFYLSLIGLTTAVVTHHSSPKDVVLHPEVKMGNVTKNVSDTNTTKASVLASLRGSVNANKIHPTLDPKSHQKFFGPGESPDYPHDLSPGKGKLAFGHPYPAVQDNGDYDADFVKDENNDGGEWKAQMTYDTLRTKLQNAREEAKRAKKAEEKANEEYRDAKKKADLMDKLSEQAEQLAEDAEKNKDDAEKEVKDAEAAPVESAVQDSESAEAAEKAALEDAKKTGDAVDDVKKDLSELEECKKKLAEAQNKLKKLMSEKTDAEDAETKAIDDEAKTEAEKKEEKEAALLKAHEKHKKELEDAQMQLQEAEQRLAEVAGKEEELKVKEKQVQKAIDAEKKELETAEKDYDEHIEDVKQTEAKLGRAQDDLAKIRRSHDSSGGVYNTEDKDKAAAYKGTRASASFSIAVILGWMLL